MCVHRSNVPIHVSGRLTDAPRGTIESSNLITSGVFAYSGTATKTDSSGENCEHQRPLGLGVGLPQCQMDLRGVILCAENEPLLDSNDRPTEARAFFRPDEINVLDNWYTTGLRVPAPTLSPQTMSHWIATE